MAARSAYHSQANLTQVLPGVVVTNIESRTEFNGQTGAIRGTRRTRVGMSAAELGSINGTAPRQSIPQTRHGVSWTSTLRHSTTGAGP